MTIFSKTYGRILTVLLAWLGFSCNNLGTLEYGTPSATFKAKGIVVSQTDDTPIEGIRAVLKVQWDTTTGLFRGIDTVYTDSKGVFNLKSSKDEFAFDKLHVELADIDGLFTDKDVIADYSNEKFTGGDKKWYRGEAEKDLGIIKLTQKE